MLRALDEHGAVSLRNRKYLGSKARLLDFIEGEIRRAAGGIESFLDGFAGSGVVAERMRAYTNRLTLIDNLASNYAINRTFFASCQANVRIDYLAAAPRDLNRLPPAPGYAAEHYGGASIRIDRLFVLCHSVANGESLLLGQERPDLRFAPLDSRIRLLHESR